MIGTAIAPPPACRDGLSARATNPRCSSECARLGGVIERRPNIHLPAEACPDESTKRRLIVDRVRGLVCCGQRRGVYVATRGDPEDVAGRLGEEAHIDGQRARPSSGLISDPPWRHPLHARRDASYQMLV